ncbi:MAG TPA: nucleotidyltransferase family protein, partial [Gemmatimonadaceae bacterium]
MSQVISLRDSAVYGQLARESAVVALTAAGPSGEPALRPLLGESLNWDEVVNLARRERAVGPVARDLTRLGTGTVPTPVLERLGRMGMVTDFHLASLHDRLGKLLALYARHDIDALLLKGAGLAYSAYASVEERPMGDIDLLVHPDVADRAWKLAVENGWRRRKDVAEERSYEDHQHLSPLEDADGLQIGLEIHIALFTQQAPFTLPTSSLWERARRITIAGAPALVPSAEDQLVHAALHFAWSHEMTFGTWRTLRDVERIVTSNPLDWAQVVTRAQAIRGGTCCYWTLRLARDLAGVAVPDTVLDALSPRLPEPVLRRLTCYFAQQA